MTTDTLEIDSTLAEELDKPTPYESALTRIEQTMNDVIGTSITSSSGVVDVMLDLRNDLERLNAGMDTLARVVRLQENTLEFYEENFGPVEVPEGWRPAWAGEQDDDLETEPAEI